MSIATGKATNSGRDDAPAVHIEPLSHVSSETAQRWRQLLSSSRLNYSLSQDWTTITAKSQNIVEKAEVVVASRNAAVVAILPIFVVKTRQAGIEIDSLELVSNLVSYHNQPLTSLQPPRFLQILLQAARERSADVVRLAGIPNHSELGQFLAGELPAAISYRIAGETSPYLTLPSSWEELLSIKPKKFRYKVRKRAEALETSSVLSMAWFKQPGDCPALLEAMRIIETNSWKQQAGISIFQRKHEQHYYELLLPFLAGRREMFANVLYLERMPIAYNLCCVHDGWVGQMKTSFDLAHADLSPGSIVIDYAIREACQMSAREFDFLGGQDPHKLAWTKDARPHTDHYLYPRFSVRGRLIGVAKSIRARVRSATRQRHD